MQTDVVHLMPFFSFFSRRKEGWWREKTERSGDLFFFVCLSLARLRLLFSLVPRLYLFFSSPSSSQKFSILLLVLLSTQKRKEPQFRVFCPHCIAITPSTIVLLVGRGGGGDCIDIKTSNAYGLHRNYHK
jgi:hypothetical protein